MSSQDPHERPPLRRQFHSDVRALPGWQKSMMWLAIVAALAGTGGYLYARFQDNPDSWAASVAPRAASIGTSIVIGFIVGWLLRAAIKLVLMVGFVIVLIVGTLAYFKIVNLDPTSIKQAAGETTEWAQEQSGRVIDWTKSVLPSAGGGAFGIFMGFRRKS